MIHSLVTSSSSKNQCCAVATIPNGSRNFQTEKIGLQEDLAQQRQDFEDLMVCLGQETAKVDKLSELLQQHDVNVQAILDQVR